MGEGCVRCCETQDMGIDTEPHCGDLLLSTAFWL